MRVSRDDTKAMLSRKLKRDLEPAPFVRGNGRSRLRGGGLYEGRRYFWGTFVGYFLRFVIGGRLRGSFSIRLIGDWF